MLIKAVTTIRYRAILHHVLANGQFDITKSVAMNGLQNITNNRSAIVRLTMRMLIFDLIVFSFNIIITTKKFPAKPKKSVTKEYWNYSIDKFLYCLLIEIEFNF